MEIKIAFVHPHYPGGGAERVTENIVRYLSSVGQTDSYRIYMFVEKLNSELLCRSDKLNITFIPVTFHDDKEDIHDQLISHIDRLGIDILVLPVGGVPNLRFVKQHTQCKIVLADHGVPGWEAEIYLNMRTHYVIASGNMVKILSWYLIKYPFKLIAPGFRRKILGKYRRNYLASDLYTVLFESYRKMMLRILNRDSSAADNDHIKVIPNYIPPRDYGDPEKRKRVIFMGRLSYCDKRVDRLLDIWAMIHTKFPDWKLCVVGDGEEKENLVRQSHALGLTNIEFHDYVAHPDKHYCDASILCLTSTIESFGLVISEGMQAGVVPIAFDVSAGIRDQISPDGINGFLVPPFDKEEYARRLAELMADDEMRRRMSLAAVTKSKEYSNESRLALWDEAFRKLVTAS